MGNLHLVGLALICGLASACSDSKSDPGPPSEVPSPPGEGSTTPYVGPTGVFDVPNQTFEPIVTLLDNGEVYGIDVIDGRVAGFFHGPMSGTSSTVDSTNLTEYNALDGGLRQPATLSVTYTTPAVTTKLTFPFGTFTGSARGQMTYAPDNSNTIYGSPVPLTMLAGSYHGELSTVGTKMAIYSDAAGFTLQNDGHFAVAVNGCMFSGVIVSHAGKGVFDATATVSGADCLIAGDLKGIAVPTLISPTSTIVAFEMLSQDAYTSVVLYLNKG